MINTFAKRKRRKKPYSFGRSVPFWLIFNNSSSPNGLLGYSLRAHQGERKNCFSKIQLVVQKYRDRTTLASKTRLSRHCFGFQSRRFSLLVDYNIWPSSSSASQNAALIIDYQLDFTKREYPPGRVRRIESPSIQAIQRINQKAQSFHVKHYVIVPGYWLAIARWIDTKSETALV